MKLLKFITDYDICKTKEISNAAPRNAVRAIVMDEVGQMALLYIGKYGFYTIPGGGIEEGENTENALKREILEETGCECEIVHELGYIRESRALHNRTQISNYYITKIIGEKGLPQMTQAEIDEQTQVQWHTPQNAIDIILNEKVETYQQKYIRLRDKIVLKEAINYLTNLHELN